MGQQMKNLGEMKPVVDESLGTLVYECALIALNFVAERAH